MKFTDVDKGYRALAQRIYGLKRPKIAVGILSGHGAEDEHEGSVGHALTLLEVAIFNEFGTATIPARSFIRAWFDQNEQQLRADLFVLMKQVVAGDISKDQALQLMAVRCVGQVQQRIADGIEPALAESTIKKKKGSSTPLIDTGQLRAGVSSRIDPG